MTELLAAIEGSTLATWTRESPSIWAYPTILTLHTLGLGLLVGANAVVDLRLLGFARRIPTTALQPLFRIMFWAFLLNALTGVLLFMSDATHKAGQTVFYVKLTLIGLALWNTAGLRKLVARPESDSALVRGSQLAVLSLLLWTGAIIAGRLMAYL